MAISIKEAQRLGLAPQVRATSSTEQAVCASTHKAPGSDLLALWLAGGRVSYVLHIARIATEYGRDGSKT